MFCPNSEDSAGHISGTKDKEKPNRRVSCVCKPEDGADADRRFDGPDESLPSQHPECFQRRIGFRHCPLARSTVGAV